MTLEQIQEQLENTKSARALFAEGKADEAIGKILLVLDFMLAHIERKAIAVAKQRETDMRIICDDNAK